MKITLALTVSCFNFQVEKKMAKVYHKEVRDVLGMAESMRFGCLIGSSDRLRPPYACAVWERGHSQGLPIHGHLPLCVSSGDLLSLLLITIFFFSKASHTYNYLTLFAWKLLVAYQYNCGRKRSSMACKFNQSKLTFYDIKGFFSLWRPLAFLVLLRRHLGLHIFNLGFILAWSNNPFW